MKRDLYVCKETYKETCRHDVSRKSSYFLAEETYLVEKKSKKETYMYEKRPVCMRRYGVCRKSSCFVSTENCLLEKNPTNETYMYEKRPVCMQTDL